MKTVAVTGADGLIGARVQQVLSDTFQFIPVRHAECDITDKKSVDSYISILKFDILLHLAAYTHVDAAEKEKDRAFAINVEGTRNVYEAVRTKNSQMIYLSTDFVFSGEDGPYDEDSQPNPVGYYGQTKYEGEQVVSGDAMIVRISYPYGYSPAPKKGFARTIASLLSQGKQLQMVDDSQFTPTYIDDIAHALGKLLHQYRPEVYHVAGSDSMTPYEAGQFIAEAYGYDTRLVKQTTYDQYFDGKAKRPRFSVMQSKKNTDIPMCSFREGLSRMIQEEKRFEARA